MSERHRPGYLPWDKTGNRVLIQSSLGKTKPTNYNIPDEDFVYGRLTPMDPEQATNLMYEWKYHQNSENPNIGKTKDIIATNKKAVKNLLHTAHQNYDFRKTQTQYKKVKEGKNGVKIYLPDEEFRYGRPGELEDPIKLLMGNDYGETDRAMRNTMYNTKMQRDNKPKRKLSCYMTKNHQLIKQATSRRMAAFNEAQKGTSSQSWKLNKFTNNIQAKVQPKWTKPFDHGSNSKCNEEGSQKSQQANQEILNNL